MISSGNEIFNNGGGIQGLKFQRFDLVACWILLKIKKG